MVNIILQLFIVLNCYKLHFYVFQNESVVHQNY
jgi:hypothetical protein